MRFAVLGVAQLCYVRRGDGDERGVAAQRLVQAHPVQLVPQRARAHRRRHAGPAVHARGEARDVVHHDPVRQADTAQGHAHAGAEQVTGQASARIHAALRPARGDDALYRRAVEEGHVDCPASFPRPTEPGPFPGPLGRRDERELHRGAVHRAGGRRAGRAEGGRWLTQAHHRHRELVHPVRAGQRGHLRIGEAGVQPGRQARRVGERQQLGQHRAGVPVHVPVAAFGVAPAGAPRDAGDHDGRAAAVRWRADLHERMLQRVVPVHARGQRAARRHRDVQLQREPAAGRPGGAERVDPVVPVHGAHHAGGQVEQAGEVRQVQGRGLDRRDAGQHGHGRLGGRGQVPRQRHAGHRLRVPLDEPREAGHVVGLQILHDPGIVDGYVPVPAGRVGGQPVQCLRRGFHTQVSDPGRTLRSAERSA